MSRARNDEQLQQRCDGSASVEEELMVEELLNLHRGQGMDLFWRDSLTCPTEEEYVQMVLGSECRGSALGWGPQLV